MLFLHPQYVKTLLYKEKKHIQTKDHKMASNWFPQYPIAFGVLLKEYVMQHSSKQAHVPGFFSQIKKKCPFHHLICCHQIKVGFK